MTARWIVEVYLLLVLTTPLWTFVHEVGHAAAAHAMGFRVFRVAVGRSGPERFARERHGTRWVLAGLGINGVTQAAPPEEASFRRGLAVFAAGGPLLSGLVAGASCVPVAFTTLGSLANVVWWSILLSNALRVLNLAPVPFARLDGWYILHAWLADDAAIEQTRVMFLAAELAHLHGHGRWEELVVRSKALLVRAPDEALVHAFLGLALANAGRLTDALPHLLRGQRPPPPDKPVEAKLQAEVAAALIRARSTTGCAP